MLLAVEVGNSQTKLAVFSGEQAVHSWRVRTLPSRTTDELAALVWGLLTQNGLSWSMIDGMALCSVVPTSQPPWEELSTRVGVPLLVARHDALPGLRVEVEHPEAVGVDRLIGCFAALLLYGGPVITVDLGTATTINYVTEDGRYLGGVIAPGVGTSAAALFERAPQLRAVMLQAPSAVLGHSTATQLQAGIIWGAAGQIDALTERIRGEAGPARAVIATGGFAEEVARASRTITSVDPLLNLEGLSLLHQRLRAPQGRRSTP